MFERLERRVRRKATARAARRTADIEARLRSKRPAGVEVVRETDRVVLVGRALRRRFITEPALRWLGLIR